MWGRPLKTHTPRGGGYPTLEDFCAVYGLNLLFGFWMPFCTGRLHEYQQKTSKDAHIYAFCLVLVSVRQCVSALSCIMYARMCMFG